MEVIIPCAGLSTRFPNMRPKYLLADYASRRMIELSAGPYIGKHQVNAVILAQHEESHQVSQVFQEIFGDQVNLVILSAPTSGPAETIYQTLLKLNLTSDTPFLVHDCDSMFTHNELTPGNQIHVGSLNDYPTIRTPANKSYVETNDQGIVISIIEKKIISDLFCVGGYQFAKVSDYLNAYQNLAGSRIGEIFISSIIDHLISNGSIFTTVNTSEFVDLGTKEDWEKWNYRPTIFCDIDGTVIRNQAPYGKNSYGSPYTPLEKNVEILKLYKDRGAQIIFTTSRQNKWYLQTRKLLDELGFDGCQLIMDMHHAQRILINDFAPTNPYPSAMAINLKRDDDSLDQMLNKI